MQTDSMAASFGSLLCIPMAPPLAKRCRWFALLRYSLGRLQISDLNTMTHFQSRPHSLRREVRSWRYADKSGPTIGRKLIVAVSTLILILYVLGYLLGNLHIYIGQDRVRSADEERSAIMCSRCSKVRPAAWALWYRAARRKLRAAPHCAAVEMIAAPTPTDSNITEFIW